MLALALLMRLLVVNYQLHQPIALFYAHPCEMGLLGRSLVEGHGYSSPFGVPTGPTAFIAPGYPTLVAAIFILFGVLSFKSAVVLIALNVAAALVTVALMMRLARDLFGAVACWTAGIFWAVALPVLWLPVIFWEASFSALFFLIMLALALRTRENPSTARWIALGIFTGIAALINPALLFSFVAIMGWVAYGSFRAAQPGDHIVPRSASWKGALLGSLALMLVFVAWPIRNAVRFHAFIPLRSTVGFELWMGNRPGATGRLDESVFPIYNHQELAAYISQGEAAYVHGKSAAAWSYIGSHPAWFTQMTVRRVYRFWSGTGKEDTSWIYQIHCLATALLGLGGLVLLFRRNRRLAWLFSMPVLLFPLPYYVTHAEVRYRLNLDTVMTLLATYAVAEIANALASRKAKTSAAPPQIAASAAS